MNSANRRKIEIIDKDIELIDKALGSDDEIEVKNIHRIIDGKYQACISNWGKSMYAHHLEYGFAYDNLEISSLKDNLRLMRAKLEAFREGWNDSFVGEPQNNVNVTVNNNISIDIAFENARELIENMPGLTDSETEEIKSKIDELERIDNESITKKKKWEKVKPIIKFALDKGVDVGIAIMTLVLQMKMMQ